MSPCPNCGARNPASARFCSQCGTALLGGPTAQPQLSTEPVSGGPLEERKTVTVLFADLVGFTARSDRADPEDVKATLRPYHTRLKQEIEHFGGTLDKFIGDGVMGVFGAPAVHEDDPERGVRAALRIQDAMAHLNQENRGLELQARVGVATGEAVVTLSAGPVIGENVTGDVVNTASRIQSVAPPGGIVVADVTYRATEDVIHYEDIGLVAVKGKAEPLRLWRATGPKSHLGVGVDLLESPPTPFVGRRVELSILTSTYRRCVRESSVQLVTVTGEPGVGKSRLIKEFRSFLDELPDIVRWRQGRCLPYGDGITFWALSEVVKALAGILGSDPPDRAAAKLDEAVARFVHEPTEREWVRSRLGPLVGTGELEATTVQRTESFAAWRGYFEAVAADRPLILVLEDLHWADEAMLEFVDHLAEWSSSVPLMIVSSTRPELYDRHPTWGGGKRNSATIPLPPLTEVETAELVEAIMRRRAPEGGGHTLAEQTRALLLERSGGNPLYAEEFARVLDQQDVDIPDTVQGLVAARLDTLSPQRKALLHDAAVVGEVFWAGALAFMSGMDEGDIRQELLGLARKELVRPSRPSTVADQAEYVFWHRLIRDVAYGQIPRAARGAKHQQVALWLERLVGERAGDRAEILAHHYLEAYRLGLAHIGPEAGEELRGHVRRYLVMAADRAMSLDVDRALAEYRQALDWAAEGTAERATILAKTADALRSAGDLGVAEGAYRQAIQAAREAGDEPCAAGAMVRLSNLLWHRGDASSSRTLLLEAIDVLQGIEPGSELADAYTEMARDEWLSGRAPEALKWCERALPLVERLDLPEELVRVLGYRGAARSELGDPEGMEDMRQALREGLRLGVGRETAVVYENLASQVVETEGAVPGLEMYRTGIEFAEHRGILDVAMFTRSSTLEPLFQLGHWDELLHQAGEASGWAAARGGGYIPAVAGFRRAQVLLYRGLLDAAAQEAETFLPAARAIQEPHVLLPALIVAARIHERSGRPDSAALALLDEYEQATRGLSGWDRAQQLHEAVRACLGLGDLARARRLVHGVEVSNMRDGTSILTAVALVKEAGGNPGVAAEMFDRAADRWNAFGFFLERAQALMGAARCRAAVGAASRSARPGLVAAREIFAGLGASSLVAEADELLAGLGSAPSSGQAGAGAEASPSPEPVTQSG